MPNTYTQILIQYFMVVKHRDCLITEKIREPLEKYITGIIQNHNHKLLSIYCMPDHSHILVGLHTNQSISSLANHIKVNSSKWINEQQLVKEKFNWQTGYGAFSYSKSQLNTIINYILNQPLHHRQKSFKEEYLELLNEFTVDYKEQYLFDWLV